MTQTLPTNTGLHTISTSTQDSVILNYSAGMSTEASKLFFPMNRVTIEGPSSGQVNAELTYTLTVDPPQATAPFTYTVEFTNSTNPLVANRTSNVLSFTAAWTGAGTKTIDVTVVNDLSTVTTSQSVLISDASATPTPQPSTTPGATPTPSATPQPNGPGDVFLPLVRK